MEKPSGVAFYHRDTPVKTGDVEAVVKKHMRGTGDPSNGLGFDLFVPPEQPVGNRMALRAHDRFLEAVFVRMNGIFDELDQRHTISSRSDRLVYNREATDVILKMIDRVLNS